MRIGIDFDRVLFDTDRFDEYYKEKSGLRHVEEDVYDEKGNYSPFKHADICNIDPEEVFNILEDLEKFLYDDIKLLEDLENHELIIVTRGNERFQMKKVRASNAEKFVDDVIVVEKGSKDEADIDILADDRKKELENSDAIGVRIQRPKEGIEKLVDKVDDLET